MEDFEKEIEQEELKFWQEKIDNEFYIDKRGKIKKYRHGPKQAQDWISLHAAIAGEAFPDSDNPTHTAHQLGWIAIGSAVYGNRIKGKPNQAQLNKLDELGFKRITDDGGETHRW